VEAGKNSQLGTYRRPTTALEGVLHELRRAIVAGELGPGERVVQDALAAQLGVSRVPIREALHILQGEGRLRHVPNYGYYVVSLTPNDLREIIRARGALEDEAVREALPRLTTGDLERMESIQERMDSAAADGRVEAVQTENYAFHLELIRPAGLVHFERMLSSLWDTTDPYHRLYFADSAHHERVRNEHRQIIQAARDGDQERLVTLLDQHRLSAIEVVITKLGPDGSVLGR
jgi:DNA-binding GntR family transcriptional regulator